MIGNDLMDLHDPDTAEGAHHPRFDERVFAPQERALLALSTDSRRLRWILWACKEAAYKVVRKLDPHAVFSPPRFVVDLGACEVTWESVRLKIDLDVNPERVHVIASDDLGDLATIVRGVSDVGDATPAVAVRRLACQALAPRLGIGEYSLDVERAGRIPRLSSAGRWLSVDLSFSHHGRFVAFAATLPEPT